jgi:hypothetical protein
MVNNNKQPGKFYNRPNIIYRAKHDDEHPFNIQTANMYEDLKGKGLELLIMCLLLSNKGDANNPTDSDWVTVKDEIRSRTGMAIKKFDKAWKRLKEMGYIENIGTRTRAQWVIWENKKPLPSPVEQIITVTGDTQTSIKETIICDKRYSKEFLEIWAAYPSEGIRKDGSTYYLKTRKEKCQQAYSQYLNQGKTTHADIMNCLEIELKEKQMTGDKYFQLGLLNWIKNEQWETYKHKVGQTVSMPYGTELF